MFFAIFKKKKSGYIKIVYNLWGFSFMWKASKRSLKGVVTQTLLFLLTKVTELLHFGYS